MYTWSLILTIYRQSRQLRHLRRPMHRRQAAGQPQVPQHMRLQCSRCCNRNYRRRSKLNSALPCHRHPCTGHHPMPPHLPQHHHQCRQWCRNTNQWCRQVAGLQLALWPRLAHHHRRCCQCTKTWWASSNRPIATKPCSTCLVKSNEWTQTHQ